MKHYDPEVQPVAADWLALDELHRIRLAEEFHRAARENVPNLKAHAAVHTIVENQIAAGFEPVIRAIVRLTRQGLSRHEAVHAVGSVITDHLFEAMNDKDGGLAVAGQERYIAAIERLSAEEWRHKYE
jgi:hypothetical protein